MKRRTFKHTFVKAFMLALISCMIFAETANAGVDSYSIYLNKKLLFKQTLDKPLTLQSLQLDKANPNDELTIYYNQCNAPNKIGSGRSIVVKDAEGKKIKEWKFEDVKGSDHAMIIPVKELIGLQKKKGASSLVLFYNAEKLEKEQKLASL
ncbi:MAG: hypothetical protein H0X70_00705 [Segetibacter sp.]|jgi:hypothetical protein|nr:hypothetical protein [Segetibacter sp.]